MASKTKVTYTKRKHRDARKLDNRQRKARRALRKRAKRELLS